MEDGMRFVGKEENAEMLGKLTEYFNAQPDGEELTWLRIEADTGVKMAKHGRSLARRALRNRPYESICGQGIRLSSAESALSIAHGRLVRIDQSVRRADKVQQELQTRHLNEMKVGEQQRLLMLASFFGAIRTVAKNATSKVFSPVRVK